jgi:hypothetical protein
MLCTRVWVHNAVTFAVAELLVQDAIRLSPPQCLILCICWHHLTCSPALQVQPKNAGRTRTLCRERPCFRTASSATRADGCDSNARSSTLAITKGAPVPSTRLIQAETLVHRRGFPLQLARITCHLPSDNNVSEQTPCETVPQAAPLLSDA